MAKTLKISKREFIRYGLLGSGAALVLPSLNLNSLTEIMKNKELKNDMPSGVDSPWKWSKEAFYYSKKDDNYTGCELCPNGCVLASGSTGKCRNRKNFNGKLYSLVYGNPCTAAIDPVEKKPLYHFYPQSKIFSIATAGCNLRCLNCQNWEISQVGPEETRNMDLMPAKVIEYCADNECKMIAYTYSEPITFYEYVFDTSKLAREKGIKNVLISNGYLNEKPLRALSKYLDAANINLKSFKESIYNDLNGGKLEPIKNTLKILKAEKVWLEITNLIVPEWTDKMDMIKEMCDWLYKNGLHEYPLHFSRFTPLYKLTQLPFTPVSTLEKAKEIAQKAGIKYVYIGNVPGNDGEDTFCPKCKKKIIERKGFFIESNNIENNCCKFCKDKISGVWGTI